MKILLGGIVALIIGVVGLVFWWFEFLRILKGVVPSFSCWEGRWPFTWDRRYQDTTASPISEEKKE